MGLARQHKQRVLAKREAETAQTQSGDTPKRAVTRELMAAQMRDHKHQLKKFKSIKSKGIKKREFLKVYVPYIEGVLAADKGAPDDVMMTLMVWAVDAGDFDRAFQIGTYALSHDMKMPKTFSRSVPEVLLEEFAEYALKNITQEDLRPTLIERLNTLIDLTESLDMVDEVKAKAFKALGLLHGEDEDLKNAVQSLELALAFDEKCGVKTTFNKLKKKLTPDTAPAPEPEPVQTET